MSKPSRRDLLRSGGGALASVTVAGALAGCLSDTGGLGTTRTTTEAKTDGPDDSDGTDSSDLTDWEESPDCVTSGERDDMDGMYDSVISVQSVVDDLDDAYAPIRFAALTTAEQELLETVTTEGGYATCETGEAFDRFLDRVLEHGEKQDDRTVFLEREGTYYGLYVEDLDQVYSY